jgi:hypothetical protein
MTHAYQGSDVSDFILERLLIYKRKNKAPRIEPLRNPRFTGSHSEKYLEFSVLNKTL